MNAQIAELEKEISEENGGAFDREKSEQRLIQSVEDIRRGVNLLDQVEAEVQMLVSSAPAQNSAPQAAE